MPFLGSLERLLFGGFLVATLLSLGLRTKPGELGAVLTSRALVLRALLANFVAVPLLAVAITRLVPLEPGPRAALLILALFPGGLTALQFTSKVKGEEAVAGAIVVLMCVLSVLVSPLLLRSVLPDQVDFSVPWPLVLLYDGLLMLVPLFAGLWLGRFGSFWSERVPKALGFVSLALFIAFILATKSFRVQAVASIGWPAVGAMLLLIVGAMAVGWFLGGATPGRRQILASTTSMRNAALAFAIAHDSPAGAVVLPSLVAFSLLMVTPNKLTTLWRSWRERRAQSTKT